MIKIAFILVFIYSSTSLLATEQEPDSVTINGKVGVLGGNWSYPSPLQLLFRKNEKVSNPFQMCHTANYRGHIAKWNISDAKLWLAKLYDCDSNTIPMSAVFGDSIDNSPTQANWFSGYLIVYTDYHQERLFDENGENFYSYPIYETIVLIQINNGEVINQWNYKSDQFRELDGKHYMLENLDPEQQVIFDGYRNWVESTMHPKTVKFWHKQRKKYLRKKKR